MISNNNCEFMQRIEQFLIKFDLHQSQPKIIIHHTWNHMSNSFSSPLFALHFQFPSHVRLIYKNIEHVNLIPKQKLDNKCGTGI